MNIRIHSKSGIPIYEQIVQQIKEEIISGNIKSGEALPSIRSLAGDLKISVITTKRAYEELEKEKMIYSIQGKGFYIDDPDLAFLEEKKVQSVEEELADVLLKCKNAGISKQEVKDMIDIFWT